MSKYHVGDAVRVREDLEDGKLYGNEVFIGDNMMVEDMKYCPFCGKKIRRVRYE